MALTFMNQASLAQTNDWAELNRYKEANLIIGLPAADENRIVFMGNSITEGWS